MKLKRFLSAAFLILLTLSCEKLDVEVPIQIVNKDGSSNARYLKDQLRQKLRRRNFQIVNYDTPLKLVIEDFILDIDYRTEVVWDDCDTGGHNTFSLRDESLVGRVTLTEGGNALQLWHIEAANYEVLRQGDPLLLEILFNDDDEDKDCTEYFVKSKCRMDNNLRACARRITADAVKKVNRLY